MRALPVIVERLQHERRRRVKFIVIVVVLWIAVLGFVSLTLGVRPDLRTGSLAVGLSILIPALVGWGLVIGAQGPFRLRDRWLQVGIPLGAALAVVAVLETARFAGAWLILSPKPYCLLLCCGIEWFSAAVLGVVAWGLFRTILFQTSWALAGLGAGVALLSIALVQTFCGYREILHIVVAHLALLPLVTGLAYGFGVWIQRRFELQ